MASASVLDGAQPIPTSAADVLALLEEDSDSLKVYALQQLDASVHEFWYQVSGCISSIEALSEDEDFSHRELAALVASKVFYHLGEQEDSLSYALGAGSLLSLDSTSDYSQATLSFALDTYVAARRQGEDKVAELDPRLPPLVEAAFGRTLESAGYGQALGLALEARRLDWARRALVESAGPQLRELDGSDATADDEDLADAVAPGEDGDSDDSSAWLEAADAAVAAAALPPAELRAARELLAELAGSARTPNWVGVAQRRAVLVDAPGVAAVVDRLLAPSATPRDHLLAFQIAFDLVDAETQLFARKVLSELEAKWATERGSGGDEAAETGGGAEGDVDAPAPAPAPAAAGEADEAGADATGDGDLTTPLLADTVEAETAAPTAPAAPAAPVAPAPPTPRERFSQILKGDVTLTLYRQFLSSWCASDPAVLRNIKAGVESRNSVCHSAAVFANAIMHAGTSNDTFLRQNLDWLAKATNWAKFSATAGLGVIHRGNIRDGRGRALLAPYLPRGLGSVGGGGGGPASGGAGGGSPYSEGGALLALGLMHQGHGGPARAPLLAALRAGAAEPVQHGACLGLGAAGLGSEDEEAAEALRSVVYADGAVSGEAAGLGLGMLFAGSGDAARADEMLAYASETAHDKVTRGLGVGVALMQFGLGDAAAPVIDRLLSHQDALLRYAGAFALALAYAGGGSNEAVGRLLRLAVSDVSDDVRRAAALGVGLVLAGRPQQAVAAVGLLSQSYNPHVRCGAALAVGIAAVNTANPEALALLEPLLTDAVDFVQQGAMTASALALMATGPASTSRSLRETLARTAGNKGAELLARSGAIMAAGVLDAGGRNACVSLTTRLGAPRRAAYVGLALFAQHWFWHPAGYLLSLALSPAALVGVDSNLSAPLAFTPVTHARPTRFAYPPPVPIEDRRSRDRVAQAVLSTTHRAKARAARKKAKEGERRRELEALPGSAVKDEAGPPEAGVEAVKTEAGAAPAPVPAAAAAAAADGDTAMAEAGPSADAAPGPASASASASAAPAAAPLASKAAAAEQPSFQLSNPGRVVPQQRRLVSLPSTGRYAAVQKSTWGIVVLEDLWGEPAPEAPEQGEPATVPAERPADAVSQVPDRPGPDLPAPPAPFEYVPS